ncbi:MFS transporter [Methylopila jiangsuensis]|uniref:MFS transporter n=1 Tax=Methylopila jiangsuensis TaxID=586230 RepID=A0A9W6JJ10_9HYPH|nr:MFS transporter [Methylopila jiangsuensis]MDR6284504.1 MFS family permease [Methylopila jiangsuensis]GLK78107.1 MFS transporter [Methylopila jiangsuensis]
METASAPPGGRIAVPLLGIAQIVSWGSSFYLLAVLATPISADTGWPLAWVVGGGSIGLLCSGIAAPFVGRMIDGFGGRPTMAVGSLLMGAGLAAVGSSTGLASYLLGWAVLGVGMGAELYDAAFSTLGRIFGASARRAITNLTLFGGFASTVCWPLSALAVEHVGWRGACFAYAAAQVLVMAPALFLLLPREAPKPPITTDSAGAGTMSSRERGTFLLLAAILMANGAVQTTVSVHLLTILQDQGMALAAAVAVGALIGPSQVGARVVEMLVGDRLHPTATLACAGALVSVGTVLLALGAGPAAVAVVLYAAGNGVWSISRGTVPLALFGPARYPVVMGRLAAPKLVVQALAPFIAGLVMAQAGPGMTLKVLAVVAAANALVAAALAQKR